MGKRQPRGGIERKILVTILWVGVTPMTLALIIGYATAHEAQRLAVQQNLATAAQKTAEGLQLALNARLRTVHNLTRSPQIIRALEAAHAGGAVDLDLVREGLRAQAEDPDEGAASLALYDAGGQLLVATNEVLPRERSHPNWVAEVTETRFIDFRYVAHERRYAARVVAPVYRPEGEDKDQLLGFLSVFQGVNSVLKFALLKGSRQGEERVGADVYQVAYGVRTELIVSYFDEDADRDPPPLKFDVADQRLTQYIREAEDADAGSFRLSDYATRGTKMDVLLAYHRLFGEDAYVVVYRPASAVYANINRGAWLALLFSAFLIAFFCVIAYRNGQHAIVRPLSLLNEGAQIIEQGDLDLKLKIDTGDEIEELASSFNRMALALRHNICQLEESEEKYRSLITSMRDGVYQTDPSGAITFINPVGAEIFGFGHAEEALGQGIRGLFQDTARYDALEAELAGKSFIERTRVWMKRHDGRLICVEISASQVFDDDGELLGTEGLFRDVTKGVRLEQEAQERSERIRVINQIANVINSSIEAGRLYENITEEVKKLVDFDSAVMTILDESGERFETRTLWPEQQMAAETRPLDLGDSCLAWVVRNDRCLIVDDLSTYDSPFAQEYPEGTRSCLCVPLYATGQIIGSLNLGAHTPEAFSERHAELLGEMAPHIAVAIRNAKLLENLQASLEEVTRAREKLHEANEELKTLDEMKTNLLSNVSHELRTPLVSVMGYTDMILNEKAGPVTEMQQEYLSISMRNTEKLVTLIENLLDFSRLHRGAEEMVFDKFALRDLARMCLQIVKPVADSREIELVLDAPDDDLFVEGDKSKLGQVFNNLLSNAVKFNDNGGTVTVSLRVSDDTVDVAVSDTGIGIPEDALDKVFSRFYQVDGSSTRKYGGTGIGLSIAQDIVRLHGSRLTVQSVQGEGSTFRFSLPLAAHRTDATPLPPQTHLLIELVSRDRALSAQLRNLLESEGMDVIHAASPEHAVALAAKYTPDCVIVDVELAEGRDAVLDALLADDRSRRLPLLALTDDEAFSAHYTSQTAARISRGFRKSSLLSGLHNALGQGLPGGRGLGSKVLCVDDDEEILTFMLRCLEVGGYEVTGCASGEEALSIARGLEHGVVLLDIAMPGIDGWETCERLKRDPALKGLLVYLVTAKPIDSSTPRMQECGADGYLLKPFKAEDLLALVQGVKAGTTAGDA